MKKIILGLDCSSTTIGWCALSLEDDSISVIDASYLKPIKEGSIIERIVDTRNQILQLIQRIQPDEIAIEDIIQFMKGKSTAQTIIMLTTFNRMIGLCAYDFLNHSPTLYNVLSIRSGLKINQLPKKEEMPEIIAHHLNIAFPYVRSTKGKNKGSIKAESFDIADGMAVALYHAFVLSGKVKRKSKPKTKKAK